jgi:hypothetical protein
MDQQNISPKIKEAMDDAFYSLLRSVLPMLNSDEGRERFLHDLARLTKWAQVMPRKLVNDEPWTKEQLHAMMLGPQELEDPRFGAYMDAFYEEYVEGEDSTHAFYSELFQNETDPSKIDWMSVWETVKSNYESWLKTEYEDEWLKGEPNS